MPTFMSDEEEKEEEILEEFFEEEKEAPEGQPEEAAEATEEAPEEEKKEEVTEVSEEAAEEGIVEEVSEVAEEVPTEEIVAEKEEAEVPSVRLLVRKTDEDLGAKVVLNPEDASKIDVVDGSIVEFEDTLSGMWGATVVTLRESQESGYITLERGLAEACGLEDDFEVEIRKFSKTPVKIKRIVFGIEAIEGDTSEAVKRVLDARNQFESEVNHRVIFRDWVLKIPSLGVLVHIVSTEPELIGKNIAIINFDEIESYDVVAWRAAVPFNAILLIDVSKSMLEKDMLVKNVQPTIEAIKSIASDIPQLNEFIEQFKEGEFVRRVDGAVFAAILYLVEKVGRGYGEKIAVITYSEDASPLSFLVTGGQKLNYFDPGKSKMSSIINLASLILDKVQKTPGAHTNMSAALKEAYNIIKTWEEENDKKPVMIVLLTDGFPDYWEEAPPVEIAHNYFANRTDTVIYTIGIGKEVGAEILQAIARQGRGQFAMADDLGQLLVWYQRLARDLVMRISPES